MSTDPEATPNLPASSPVGQPPGALALLTATALGSIVASRLPKAPFVVAAGVTALALLKPRKAPAQPPSPSPPFPPAPPAESLAHDPVGDWLRQQIEREAAAPAVTWPPIDEPAAVPAADDDYTPPSFLLDDEAQVHRPAAHDVFASLTEPLDFPMRLAPSIAAENESEAAEPSPDALASSPDLSVDDASSASEVVLPIEPGAEGTTLPTHFPSSFVWPATTALQPDSAATSALFAPPPAALAAETNPEPVVSPPAVAQSVEPTSSDIHDTRSAPESSNAAWLLGIEPIPSLGESSPPAFPEPSSLFTDIAPARPVFTTGLFQGASLPDEIEVPPHPPQPEPPAPLPPPSPPTPEPPTPVPPIPEPPVPAPVPHLMPVFTGTSACESESSAMRWHSEPSIASSDHPFVIHTHHNLEAPGTNGAFPHSPPPLEAPTSDPVLEIPVHLAAPGEASFDPPPLDIAQDFWHSTDGTSAAEPTAAGAESPASPSSPLLSGPVIDAEIVLRPRGLPQNTVTSRTKPLAPVSTTPPSPSAPAIESANASNPLPPPRDKRPRSTWRSWWRGD